MNFFAWLIFGALAGWVASIITGRNSRMGCLANIFIGIVGAFLGGWIYSILTGQGFSPAFNLSSFVIAVLGASLLLIVTGLFSRRR